MTGEVYYFEADAIRATRTDDFANRLAAKLPAGQMPIGQSAFSPDGRWFAYIHADERAYRALLADREARSRAGTFHWNPRPSRQLPQRGRRTRRWRSSIPLTGVQRVVVETDYHFHHVLFVDDRTMLINHPRGVAGMWVVGLDGKGIRHLRPETDTGAHGAMVNHQVVTARGIAYEAVAYHGDGTHETYFGSYDPQADRFSEALLPTDGYVHVGFDPAGRFDFVENAGREHAILTVHPGLNRWRAADDPPAAAAEQPGPRRPALPRPPVPVAADRKWLYFTDWSPQGFAQICALDVADLVATADLG